MQKTLKPVLSLLVIGFFLLITMATKFEDFLLESTNETVKIKNCEDLAQVTGTLTVAIIAVDGDDQPVKNLDGQLFVTHQIVKPDSCTFDVVFNTVIPFTTNDVGVFVYIGPEWAHDNSQDLWRAEVFIDDDSGYSYSKLKVRYYSESDFTFNARFFD